MKHCKDDYMKDDAMDEVCCMHGTRILHTACGVKAGRKEEEIIIKCI